MANWLKTKDIKLCGWQEMAMEHNEAEDSIIRNNTGAIYVWVRTQRQPVASYPTRLPIKLSRHFGQCE